MTADRIEGAGSNHARGTDAWSSLRALRTSDRVAIGGWCAIGNAFAAEIMASAGYDWYCVDMQHGLVSYDGMLAMIQVLGSTGKPVLVRVPWNDPADIMRALDAGAHGVIVPMVNTPEEAGAVVAACRYPPVGQRSWGPTRAALGDATYTSARANRDVLCVVMIETVPASDRLGEILAVPGVDAVLIGTTDFALSMDLAPGSAHEDVDYQRRLADVVKVCREKGLVPGVATRSIDMGRRWRDAGFRMLAVQSDAGLLGNAATQLVETLRSDDGDTR